MAQPAHGTSGPLRNRIVARRWWRLAWCCLRRAEVAGSGGEVDALKSRRFGECLPDGCGSSGRSGTRVMPRGRLGAALCAKLASASIISAAGSPASRSSRNLPCFQTTRKPHPTSRCRCADALCGKTPAAAARSPAASWPAAGWPAAGWPAERARPSAGAAQPHNENRRAGQRRHNPSHLPHTQRARQLNGNAPAGDDPKSIYGAALFDRRRYGNRFRV